ncbi:hypothetical protein DMN91_008179 [Ooceraea biroi]|uniref:Uncharacterized protein n=1 Tax=Ooceraea biroi TaxID=2015173 RepID=A0A3L8DHF9_OOCBI|nr:uncharacterized protein LOC113562367 [Ooceraea biroi]RLU19622.1 hypothetical protein DMN91_008179 [Ooceraea biroi]
MVPLSWALSRALRYRPSDPKHYIAHQLLRWKYGNVSQKEMHYAQQFVISATITMDQRLLQERKKKETLKYLNEAVKDVPCDVCLEQQKLYRVKKRCSKCTRVSASTHGKDKVFL